MDYHHSRIVLRKKLRTTNTWVSEADGIVLADTFDIRTSKNIGKRRDSLNFSARNPNNALHETFFSGDNSTVAFTLKYSPIPSQHLSGSEQKFFVYISDVLQTETTNYSVSGSTLTFVSAPATANRNIRVVYPVVEADDLVDIYFWKNNDFSNLTTTQKNAARAEEGLVIEPTLTKGKNIISVRGYGLMDVIFSGMAFALAPDTDDNAHEVIQAIISQLNQFNPNKRIFGQDSTEWTAIGNDTTSKDITYTSKYRTAVEMIEELSGDRYTGDGQYIYFVQFNARAGTTDGTTANKLVDSTATFSASLSGLTVYNTTDGTDATITAVDSGTVLSVSSDIFVSGEEYSIPTYDFHWKTKPTTSTGTLTEGTDPNDPIKVRRAVDDVINVVIYNCGLDPFGRGMEFLNYDFTITGFGSRWKYVSETDTIGRDIIETEFKADQEAVGGKWDVTTAGSRISNFPNAYNYTFYAVEDRDSLGVKSGSNAVATSDNSFADIVRDEAKWQGKERTDRIIKLYSNPRFKADLIIEKTTESTFVLGDMYELAIPAFGLDNKKLRLFQIDQEFDKIILHFEEDETTVI